MTVKPDQVGALIASNDHEHRAVVSNSRITELRALYTEITDRIQSFAKIIFIGACDIGDEFKSLWDITGAPGSKRALIVPEGAYTATDLTGASVAWLAIATALSHGKNVDLAVRAGNDALRDNAYTLRFIFIGDINATAK